MSDRSNRNLKIFLNWWLDSLNPPSHFSNFSLDWDRHNDFCLIWHIFSVNLKPPGWNVGFLGMHLDGYKPSNSTCFWSPISTNTFEHIPKNNIILSFQNFDTILMLLEGRFPSPSPPTSLEPPTPTLRPPRSPRPLDEGSRFSSTRQAPGRPGMTR